MLAVYKEPRYRRDSHCGIFRGRFAFEDVARSKQSAAGNHMSGMMQLLLIQDSCGFPMGQMLPGLDDPKNPLFSGNTLASLNVQNQKKPLLSGQCGSAAFNNCSVTPMANQTDPASIGDRPPHQSALDRFPKNCEG